MAEYRGDRVKELRESNNMSQEELSGAIGVARLSIGNYERGVRKPDVETLNKLADTFSVSTDYLLGRSDAKKPENEALISEFGLTNAAIETIRSLKTAQPTLTDKEPMEDARTLLDVFNGFLADSCFLTFLSLVRVLTHAEKWSFAQWEGDDRATPQLSIGDAERTAFLEKWLSELLEVMIDSMRQENLRTKTRNANVNLFNDKD